MPQRLPPLTWLRAFEAAGRLESFRAAAEELHVTPSTISHHIGDLETQLQVPLFQRGGNGVRLTREGEAYLTRISRGFAVLTDAAQVLQAPAAVSRLSIGAFPFLVSEVLIPGLGELRARLGPVTVSVVSDTRLSTLTEADPQHRLDAVIRYGQGRFAGCVGSKLSDVSLVVVAAPDLAGSFDRAGASTPLDQAPRVGVAGPFDGWGVWARGAGVRLPAGGDELVFDSYLSAMRAVEQGLGLGLGIRPFIHPWLQTGRVVVVDPREVPAGQDSYLVTARYRGIRPQLQVLGEWLAERLAPLDR